MACRCSCEVWRPRVFCLNLGFILPGICVSIFVCSHLGRWKMGCRQAQVVLLFSWGLEKSSSMHGIHCRGDNVDYPRSRHRLTCHIRLSRGDTTCRACEAHSSCSTYHCIRTAIALQVNLVFVVASCLLCSSWRRLQQHCDSWSATLERSHHGIALRVQVLASWR